MAGRILERIRRAIREGRYDVTAHAVEEMAEDGLRLTDVQSAVSAGMLAKTAPDDPRGTRYTIHGFADDDWTPVATVGRFTATGRYLIITVYKITESE